MANRPNGNGRSRGAAKPPAAPRRVVTTRTEYEEPENEAAGPGWSAPPGDDLDYVDEGEEKLRAILEGMGPGDIRIKVFRVTQGGREYCFSTDTVIDEDFLQEAYGGGRYEGKIFVNGSYRTSIILNIAKRANVGATAGGGAVADNPMLQVMRDQINELRAELREARNAKTQPTSIGELTQALVALHGLGGGGGGGTAATELLLKGVELGKNIAGGKDGDDWIGLVREALPMFGGLMNARRPGASGAPVSSGPGITSDNPQKTLGPGGAESLPQDQTDAVIASGLAYLKTKGALKGADPLLFVDWCMVNADEPQYQPIIEFAINADIPALAKFDPDIAKPPLSAWFEKFLFGLRSALAGEDSVDEDTGGATGDSGNAPANGGAVADGGRKRKP